MKMNRRAAVTALFVSLSVLGLSPRADACVQTLKGTLTTHAVPCETICTEGPLTGGLAGKLEFTMDEMVETGIPNVVRYTGINTITTEKGVLVGPDVGYWNLATGEFIDYMDIESGTGEYTGARGKLTIIGKYDLTTGVGASNYFSVVTTP